MCIFVSDTKYCQTVRLVVLKRTDYFPFLFNNHSTNNACNACCFLYLALSSLHGAVVLEEPHHQLHTEMARLNLTSPTGLQILPQAKKMSSTFCAIWSFRSILKGEDSTFGCMDGSRRRQLLDCEWVQRRGRCPTTPIHPEAS